MDVGSERQGRAGDRRGARRRARDRAALAAEGAAVAVNYRCVGRRRPRRSSPRSRRPAARRRPTGRRRRISPPSNAMVDAVVERLRRARHPDQQCRARAAPALRRDHAGRLAAARSTPVSTARSIAATPRRRISKPRKNGRIISVIGDSSRVGESGLAIVAAARAGVVALMKSLAREFGRSGTTANTVSLGLVETAHDKRLGRGEPREAGEALSGAAARPAGRHRADGGAAGLAAHAAGSPGR